MERGRAEGRLGIAEEDRSKFRNNGRTISDVVTNLENGVQKQCDS